MKITLQSILLALQFFTVIPIKKELPLTKKSVTGMMLAIPWVAAIMGAMIYVVITVLQNTISPSPMFLAFTSILLAAIFTGGLHYDGLIDTGDAYFSYRDITKRLAILDDPHVGAFGVMTFVFVILAKFVLLYELIASGQLLWWMFVWVPFLVRVAMLFFFTTTKCAKNKGLAYFFKSHFHNKLILSVASIYLLATTIALLIYTPTYIPIIVVAVLLIALWQYRRFALRNFTGVSGDMLGALIEGMEVILWLTLLLCA